MISHVMSLFALSVGVAVLDASTIEDPLNGESLRCCERVESNAILPKQSI